MEQHLGDSPDLGEGQHPTIVLRADDVYDR
jgi:hypothetical protein